MSDHDFDREVKDLHRRFGQESYDEKDVADLRAWLRGTRPEWQQCLELLYRYDFEIRRGVKAVLLILMLCRNADLDPTGLRAEFGLSGRILDPESLRSPKLWDKKHVAYWAAVIVCFCMDALDVQPPGRERDSQVDEYNRLIPPLLVALHGDPSSTRALIERLRLLDADGPRVGGNEGASGYGGFQSILTEDRLDADLKKWANARMQQLVLEEQMKLRQPRAAHETADVQYVRALHAAIDRRKAMFLDDQIAFIARWGDWSLEVLQEVRVLLVEAYRVHHRSPHFPVFNGAWGYLVCRAVTGRFDRSRDQGRFSIDSLEQLAMAGVWLELYPEGRLLSDLLRMCIDEAAPALEAAAEREQEAQAQAQRLLEALK